MNLLNRDSRSYFVNGAFRPLRRVWMFTWLALCAIGAIKLVMEFLGL